MNVSSIITVGYKNKSPIRAPKKQTQFSKRQKPMQPPLPQRIMKIIAFSGSGQTKPNKPKQSQPVVSLPALIPSKEAQSKGSNLFQTAYLLIDRARPEFLNFLLKKPQIRKITYKAGACLCRFVYIRKSLYFCQGQKIIIVDFRLRFEDKHW